MSQLIIELRDGQKVFRPGDEIAGAAFWKTEAAPKSVEVRLFWRTRGRGTEDVTVVDTLSFPDPKPEEARPFQFTAPQAPYSFSGKLISLLWGLEIIVEPGMRSAQVELTIGPDGREVSLPQ